MSLIPVLSSVRFLILSKISASLILCQRRCNANSPKAERYTHSQIGAEVFANDCDVLVGEKETLDSRINQYFNTCLFEKFPYGANME